MEKTELALSSPNPNRLRANPKEALLVGMLALTMAVAIGNESLTGEEKKKPTSSPPALPQIPDIINLPQCRSGVAQR